MTDRPRPVRLADVAAHAGLAPTTISRFLNGRIVLPPATAERIRASIAELDYRPHPQARSLSTGTTGIIGFAIPDIANPFFARLAAAVEAIAFQNGKSLMIASTRNTREGEGEVLDRLRSGMFDGLVFASNRADRSALAAELDALDRPVVVIDEDVADSGVMRILPQNEEGGYLAGRVLVDAGHRAIAYVGGPEGLPSTMERERGLARALGEVAGAKVVASHLGDYSLEHGRAAMTRVLSDNPAATAVFCGADVLAMGALGVLHAEGRRIGRDVSLVAFDDAAPLEFIDPPITAIRAPIDEIARRAVEALLAPSAPGAREIRCPVELVERNSVGAPETRAGDTHTR